MLVSHAMSPTDTSVASDVANVNVCVSSDDSFTLDSTQKLRESTGDAIQKLAPLRDDEGMVTRRRLSTRDRDDDELVAKNWRMSPTRVAVMRISSCSVVPSAEPIPSYVRFPTGPGSMSKSASTY